MGAAKGVEVRANSIRVKFTWQGKQERRTIIVNGQPLTPSPANIRYAERLAAEIREKIRLDTFSLHEYFPASGDTEAQVTLSQQLADFIATKRITASTKAGYEAAANFWNTALPGALLKSVKHSQVLKALADRPDLSGKTVNNYTSVLREAYELAVKDGLVKTSPVEGVDSAKWQKEPPDPFNAEEREKIIALMQKRWPGHVANMVEFWFWTGLRTGEILGLQWSSVDLKAGHVVIREAKVRGEQKDTKTSVARTVILNSRAREAIKRQRALSQVSGGSVFLDPRTGKAWEKEQPFRQNFWSHALKALEIRYRRAYNMRHTYATAMLMAGMTPAFCARQLGHSKQVFFTTYSKWIDGERDELEMSRLEATLGAKSGLKTGSKGE